MKRASLLMVLVAILAAVTLGPAVPDVRSAPATEAVRTQARHWTEFSQESPGLLRYSPPDWEGDWNPWGFRGGACFEYMGGGKYDWVSCATATPHWYFKNFALSQWHKPRYNLVYSNNAWGYPGGPCLVSGYYDDERLDFKDCKTRYGGWQMLQAGDRLYLRSTFVVSSEGIDVAGSTVALRRRNGTYHIGQSEGDADPGSLYAPEESATFMVREVVAATQYGDLWRSLGLDEAPPAAILRLGCWNGTVVARGTNLSCSEARGAEPLEVLMFASRPSSAEYTTRLQQHGAGDTTQGIAIVGRAAGWRDWSTFGVFGTVTVTDGTVTVDGRIMSRPGVLDDRPNNQFVVWKLNAE